MFEHLDPAPPDAILGLTEAFVADPNPRKINLGVGVYKNEEGVTPVLDTVKEAERRLLAEESTKSYLPIAGSPAYGDQVQRLVFGEQSAVRAAGRAATAHTPGGTGALRVGADLLRTLAPQANVWLSTPTWANHKGVFSDAGFSTEAYPYYDAAAKAVDFSALRTALAAVPAGDVVVLHVCCHNPTGADPDMDQWRKVASLARERGWTPFLDFAYQGLADGIEEDALPLAPFAEQGIEFLLASSFSKNFGLYRERTGALTVVASDRTSADTVLGHLKLRIRRNFSNPPAHGGDIVVTVLGDPELRARWVDEVAGMRNRIRGMREALVRGLARRGVKQDFGFIERQRGMFSYSGLTDDQVEQLRREHSIYIVRGGRINVAGITPQNVDYLCEAIAGVL
jgi:aspartate/tyrosine/aromatic aminotransferase